MANILTNDEERKRLHSVAENQKNKFDILPLNNQSKSRHVQFGVSKFLALLGLIFTIVQFGYHLLTLAYETHQLQNEQQLFHVTQSWFGLYRDDSDFQWREYRANLPIFLSMAAVFLLISQFIKQQFQKSVKAKTVAIKLYYVASGICFLLFVFGAGGALMWFILTFFNYILQKLIARQRIFPYILWALSIYTLYYNYYFHEEPFHILVEWVPTIGGPLYESYSDSLVPWYMVYNMTLLRVISFGMDKYWFFRKQFRFDFVKHLQKCDECTEERFCYKNVSETYCDEEEYDSILSYYAYLLYVPLLITGPQVTFNGFNNQVKNNQNVYSKGQVIWYTVRALNDAFILEVFNHVTFASALGKISSNRSRWINFSPQHCYFMGFSNLIFIWLKFLTIWRIARSISLLDGINCPENMNRCIMNNYCFEGFWRSWHRGFNQWLIRYLFIPLGGSAHKLWNIWVVFTFVAIWHDFNLNLIVWAWVICASLMPEIGIKSFLNSSKCRFLWKTSWFKFVSAAAGAMMIMMMVIANLIGFGNGLESEGTILDKFLSYDGLWGFFVVFMANYSAVIFQYYKRDQEELTSKESSRF